MKDWIRYDDQVDNTHFVILTLCQRYNSLMICADICNRMKHLKLKREWVEAKVKGRNIVIVVNESINIGSNENVENNNSVEIRYNHVLVDGDENEFNAIQVARDAVRD